MNRIAKVLSQISDDMLMHYGVARRSGRYPWGSGDNPYQHSGDFLSRVQSLKKSGMSETDIAKTMGLTTTQLRTQMSLAKDERRAVQVATAKDLREKGYSLNEMQWSEIGKGLTSIGAVKGAVNGVKSFLGIHSPSKLFAQFGRYTDEGFINGVKAYAGKVSDATVDMGKGAVGAMSDTLSTIADLVDSDIDSEPTIRPVMDLSNIQNGANQLFSMMKSVDGYSLSGSLDIANRTGSRINEVRSKTTDNSSVLDKISDAVGNFNGGNSFENTFNITGSNPKEIAEEVSNIIQRQVERRDASWA